VVISEGAVVKGTTIRGPAVIGAGATITDSYIGPYTAIGEECVVEGSEVEHSILLRGAKVRGLATRMEASLLGRDVTVASSDAPPKTIRMMVGDSSELTLP
jgi:glucose-1-phosphate thymidylyltransferase